MAERQDGEIDVAALIDRMAIEVVAVDALKPYARNPRINDGAVDYVANSIKRFGWRVPIVIHGTDNEIVNGHTRWKAAKQLGLTRVPCLRADELTESEIRALRLADNKVGELAKWDDALLKLELDGLADAFDMPSLGFDLPNAAFDESEGDATASEGEDNGSANYQHTLRFDKTIIPLTDDEADDFKRALDRYCDENGVVFGFIRKLLERAENE